MAELKRQVSIAAGMAFVLACLMAHGQNFGGGRSLVKSDAVQYLFPEQVSLTAGKPSVLTLHFRIAPGLHINSHTPSSEFLIPTTFSIPDGAGVKLEGATYPQGREITLPLDPRTKLSVYTGDFTIEARIVSTAGNHLVEAKLRYQACDKNECMPPRTIPVAIDVIGK